MPSIRMVIMIAVVLAGSVRHGLGQFYQPPSVFVMAAVDNAVYIGGIFQSLGGVAVSNICRWTADDRRFHAMGKGVRFVVEQMTVGGGRLYVAGFYPEDYRPALASWDGHSWSDVRLPASLRGILGLTIDPWGYVCLMSTIRDTIERPVLWRSNGGEWANLRMPMPSVQRVKSVVTVGKDVFFSQGAAVWCFNGQIYVMIEGADPRSGQGQGISGSTFPSSHVFAHSDTLFAVGSSLQRWTKGKWELVSSLPEMGGSFVRVEALAASAGTMIISRSFRHREIDIGWDVRRLNRWQNGKWSIVEFPYSCNAMAIVGNYLLTGHVSDETQPVISVRRITDVPWIQSQ